MRVKLDERLVRKLLAFPESGMGYQRVDARLQDGREFRDVIAYNAEELELPDAANDVTVVDVTVRDVSAS